MLTHLVMTFRPRLETFALFATLLAACSDGGPDQATATTSTCPAKTGTTTLPTFGGSGSSGTAIEEVTSFGANPGGLKMYVHAPADKAPKAIVLALHGCTQSAAAYVSTGWNELADREGLVIVYGEQTMQNDPTSCFRWWVPEQIGRGGEAESLANMVAAAHAKYGTKRAFVTGLSAGAAMTAVMLAAYPEVFEAGAIMSGLPYKCATSQIDAFSCMSGKTESADAWGALVPKSGAPAPRVSIWQGDADYTVRPANRVELVKQWTKVNGISDTPSDTTTVGPATHYVHRDTSGTARVESWLVKGMPHGVALDPKSGCGTAAAYELDVGVCSTMQAASFFLGTLSSETGTGDSPGAAATPVGADPCH